MAVSVYGPQWARGKEKALRGQLCENPVVGGEKRGVLSPAPKGAFPPSPLPCLPPRIPPNLILRAPKPVVWTATLRLSYT